MAEVDLHLVSSLPKLVQAFRDVQMAARDFHTDIKKQLAEEKEILKDQQRALRDMKLAWQDASPKGREKIANQMKELNLHINETKDNIDSMKSAIAGADDKKKSLLSTFKKGVGILGSLAAAYGFVKRAIESTSRTSEDFGRVMDGLKAQFDVFMKSVASGNWEGFRERMKNAKKAAQDYSDALANASHAERALAVQRAEAQDELNRLDQLTKDASLDPAERQRAMDEYMAIEERFANQEIEIKQDLAKKTAEAMAAKVDLEDKALQDMIRLYNEDKNIRKEALEYYRLFNTAVDKIEEYRNFETVRNLGGLNAKATAAALKFMGIRKKEADDMMEQLKIEQNIFMERVQNEYKFTEEQLKQYAVYVQKYGDLTEEELNLVADSLKAQAEANQRMSALGATKQRLQNQIDNAAKEQAKKAKDDRDKLLAAWEKSEDGFNKKIAALRQQNVQDGINAMDEENRIIAQAALDKQMLLDAQKEMLTEYKKAARIAFDAGIISKEKNAEIQALEKIKEITDAIVLIETETYAKLTDLREREYLKSQDQRKRNNDELTKLWRENEELELDLIEASEVEKLKLKLSFMELERENLTHENEAILDVMRQNLDARIALLKKQITTLESTKKDFNIWEYFGLDDKQVAAGKVAAKEIVNTLNTLFDRRVKDAERTRSLLDRQIQEQQTALNAELALLEEGYASNVRAKQEEVERLQAEREKALKEEERAIDKQRAFENMQQVTSLITASANLYKSLSSLPFGIGIALATALTASMFAAFARSKAEAKSLTKLETGGLIDEYGEVKGKRHSQGGERLLDHVEVEDGEKIAVFNRLASRRYDKQIRYMVDMFNSGEIPMFKHMPNMPVVVNNFADTRKLDSIDAKLGVLNDFFMNSTSVTGAGGQRIEKRRNFTRVIHG